MKEVTFRCKNCGRKFKTRIFEKGEAEAECRQTGPVVCPECKSVSVERY